MAPTKAKKKPANAKRKGSKFTNAELEQQRLRALDLHSQGYSLRQIADELGVAVMTADSRLKDALTQHEVHARYELYRADQLFHTKNMIRKFLGLIHEWKATHQKIVGRPGNEQVVDVSNVPELQTLSAELRSWLETEMKLTGTIQAPRKGSDDLEALTLDALIEIVAAGYAAEQSDDKMAAELTKLLAAD